MQRVLAILVLGLALVAGACGGAQEEGDAGSDTVAPTTTTDATTPTTPTTTVSETVTDGPEMTDTTPDTEKPPITVESPTSGQAVSSPIAFKGTATVFEGTVSVTLLSPTGEKVAEQFVTATCGNGCRGTYRGTIDAGTYTGPATLRFYESSADDGTELHVVEVPVQIS